MAAYQYNKAIEWGRGVYGNPNVALLYKDTGIVAGGAILDHENGIPAGIQSMPFQCDQSISRNSWGYVENEQYWSTSYLVNRLVDIVSKNGNMMLSINPKADGTLPDSTTIRLKELGSWMGINSEAIYATRPAETFGINGENQIRFTRNKDNTVIYIFSTNWPGNNSRLILTPLRLGKLNSAKISKITLLGNGETALKWSQNTTALSIIMPSVAPSACKYCYVFKVYLDNELALPARPSNLTKLSVAKGNSDYTNESAILEE
jgi:alpha-L-fucosidase